MFKKINLHFLFEFGVAIKGLKALLELLSAFVVYFLHNSAMNFVTKISTHDLTDDNDDILVNFFVHQATHVFTSAHVFVAIYLLVSAVINLILVVALLTNHIKAYPVAIGIVGMFIVYQVYRIYLKHSPWLVLFTLFDMILIFLIYVEYKRQKRLQDPGAIPAIAT